MGNACRLNFIVDEAHRLVIIRPIGDMPAMDFVDQLFEGYRSLGEPWTYHRVTDMRRFEGFIDQDAIDEIVRRWNEMTAGITYSAKVALVTTDALDRARLPTVSPQFPYETICPFTDFHEAVGWLLSETPDAYLAGLAEMRRPEDDSRIIIE